MAFRYYNIALRKWPLGVSMATGFTLSFTADITAQKLFEPQNENGHDWIRSLRMGGYAFLVWAPVGFVWFNKAERMFPGNSLRAVLKKLTIDQIIVCPTFLIFFLTSNELLQGNSISKAIDRIKQDYIDTQLNNWSVWTPAQLANFYLVPLLYRVVWTRLVSFFWSIYLSWKAHRELDLKNQNTNQEFSATSKSSSTKLPTTNFNNNNIHQVHPIGS